MDTDDDVFTSLSPPNHPSPPANRRRLKRLKKLTAESTDEISSSFPNLSDSSESQALELDKEEDPKEIKRVLKFGDEFGEESMDKIPLIVDSDNFQTFKSSDDFDVAGEIEKGEERRERKRALDFGDVDVESGGNDGVGDDLGDLGAKGLEKKMNREEPRGSKRVLEFGDVDVEFGGNNGVGGGSRDANVEASDEKMKWEEGLGDLDVKGLEKKIESEESLDDSNKKNKKRSASGVDDGKAKLSVSNKRREEKERKIYLQQLHVESQKLLRETRDASFKPIPVVHKPISSVLEKIRQRKLEVMKKTVGQKYTKTTNASLKEVVTDDDMENVSTEKGEADESAKVMLVKSAPFENSSDDSLGNNGLQEASKELEDEDSPSQMALDEQPMQAFRAPLDDTRDLFSESQSSEGKEDISSDRNSCPLEEVFAPSLLAMNLKFDSAPPDNSSSDEEDNDKENVSPGLDIAEDDDPVKAFVDEEAEEEDDSDNDIRFGENEEEDYEDDEELKDLIATGYKENPMDSDIRNELHQKWLEQQDASGTDNLMQRLKYGSKLKETGLFDDDDDDDDDDQEEEDAADDEELYDEVAELPLKESVAQINTRKAKQMIPRMFSDKNDGYLSSDDEELEKKLTKQRLLDNVEKQSTLASPAEDENSREVFGLIKKLNIVPDTKKKAKASSIFDKTLTGGRANDFSKSSFVGRKGNHSVPSSHKQGTSTIRSFIFGRDDSNSRSSLLISEDSSDVTKDVPPTRNVTSKFSSSQFKFSSQITKSTSKTASGPSLFEFLKRSSIQSDAVKEDTTVDFTQTVYAAFKIPKKRIERRF